MASDLKMLSFCDTFLAEALYFATNNTTTQYNEHSWYTKKKFYFRL
jgi:hypothetical protein